MKKHIKKIILCLSLFMVLVSSLVLPSFAYTVSSDDMTTWEDYMGENTLYYALFSKNISKNSYEYYQPYDSNYYIIHQTIKPTDFGNYATYNGSLAFRFATSNNLLSSSYMYQLGYFDIPAVNRYYSTSTSDGAIKINVYDVDSLYTLYKNGSDLSDIPLRLYIEQIFQKYKAEGYNVSKNEKIVITLIKKSFYDNNASNLFMGVCIFPNIATSESIYLRQYGTALLANINYQSVKKSYESLQSTHDKLNSDFNILKQQYIDLQNEHTDCSGNLGDVQGENLLLQSQVQQLQNQVGQLTTKNNNLTVENKDLKESLGNVNALTNLGNGIGQGFTSIIDSISNLGVGGLTVGACITVAVVVFVVFIIIKLVLR